MAKDRIKYDYIAPVLPKLKVPFVEFYDDYHEIQFKLDELRAQYGKKIKAKEIDFDEKEEWTSSCERYIGIFFISKCPPISIIKQLLKISREGIDNPHNLKVYDC